MNYERWRSLGKRIIPKEYQAGLVNLLFHNPIIGRFTREMFKGEGNVVDARGARLSGIDYDIIGDRNRIVVGPGSRLKRVRFFIRGSDNRLLIGESCSIGEGSSLWLEDGDCELKIGSNTTMGKVHIAVTEIGSRVSIGQDCLLAYDIDIRTGDSHAILDNNTGERINYPQDVTIGDHVWVGAHVNILKGVTVGAGSVIGTGSVVTRSCEPGSLLAGNPARVIKSDISWASDRLADTVKNTVSDQGCG